MPRNTIKGTNTRPKSNKATGRDYSYDKKYQASPERIKYRTELSSEAYKRGIYGKRHEKGIDLSHDSKGGVKAESKSANRARNGHNGKSSKRKG